jgi:pyruvate decarboxylase
LLTSRFPPAYPAVSFHTILPKLAHVLKSKNVVPGTPQSAGLARRIPDGPKNEVIRQDAFWPMWGKFFREHDIILAETGMVLLPSSSLPSPNIFSLAGTSAFGMVDVPLPKGATFVSQVLYGSIGFAGGALLGCLKAAEESRFKRRTILFIGDGSLYASFPLSLFISFPHR